MRLLLLILLFVVAAAAATTFANLRYCNGTVRMYVSVRAHFDTHFESLLEMCVCINESSKIFGGIFFSAFLLREM